MATNLQCIPQLGCSDCFIGLRRESLCCALGADGNPGVTTVLKVARALGVELRAADDPTITAAAKSDRDVQPLTPAQLAARVPLRSLRGRPKSENKKPQVSVRYCPEVVAHIKSTGESW